MKIPDNMLDGFLAEPRPDGQLAFGMVRAGECVELDAPVTVAAAIAAQVLSVARQAKQASGQPLAASERLDAGYPTIEVSRLGIASSELPGHQCLVLGFGDVRLGINLPNAMLRQLAQVLMTASASGRQN